jgi:hypothetical protein
MSYESKIDELVGQYAAEFQNELTLASSLKSDKDMHALPYGYPLGVYRPHRICRIPQVKHFIAKTGGRLSNGVPRVLSMELVNDYVLGLYNPGDC